MTRTLLVGLGAAAVLLAACSPDETDFQDAATEVIEGDLSAALAIGDLDATCDEPTSKEAGTTFACTATTPDGQTLTLTAEIQDEKEVFVQTTNVLTVENLGTIEAEAARILSEQVGEALPAENLDCGGQPVIADVSEPIVCALTDPANGDVYDTSITLDDLTNPTQLDVEVAATPRP